jgi:anti-sigma regulatory factor (Ser/Thr protein kinase)
LLKRYHIKARDFVKAGEGSIQIQGLLKTIGFDPGLIRRISICAYEAEMNVVMHGGDGEMRLLVEPKKIILEVSDNGPGIADIELALQEGYSTALPEYREMGFGAGMGLPNIKKNADSLDIQSGKGEGAHLTIYFEVQSN